MRWRSSSSACAGATWPPTRATPGRRWAVAAGATTLSVLVLAPLVAACVAASLTVVLAGLLAVGSSMHVAATGWLPTVPEVRVLARARPGRFYVAPALLVLGASSASLALRGVPWRWVVLAFLTWQLVHFAKQNVGMCALAASGSGARALDRVERGLVLATGLAGAAGLLASPRLLQLDLRSPLAPAFGLAAVAYGVAATVGLVILARRAREDRPWGFAATFLGALCFSAPVFVLRVPYAAVAGMWVAHGLQYLLVVGTVAACGRTGAPRRRRVAQLLAVCVAGGLALRVAADLRDAPGLGHLVFGAYLGVVAAHFVVDAALWRARDPRSRRFLEAALPHLVRTGRQPPESPPRARGARSLADRSSGDIG